MSGDVAKKSIWESGSRGVQKRPTMQIDHRGLRAERENQDDGDGLEMPTEMPPPGFVK